jgi:hypothetical protein
MNSGGVRRELTRAQKPKFAERSRSETAGLLKSLGVKSRYFMESFVFNRQIGATSALPAKASGAHVTPLGLVIAHSCFIKAKSEYGMPRSTPTPCASAS